MAGLITPNDCRLDNKKSIITLLNSTKRLYLFIYINNHYIILLFAIIVNMAAFLWKASLYETIVYGIPNTFLYLLWVFHLYNTIGYHFMVFFISCKYFKKKLLHLNENFDQANSGRTMINFRNIVHHYYVIYQEIHDDDSSFWSKFLLAIWLVMGSAMTFFLYILSVHHSIPGTSYIHQDYLYLCLYPIEYCILVHYFHGLISS